MIDTPIRASTRLKDGPPLRWARKSRTKIKRVSRVVVDQRVSCPRCDELMQLSDEAFRCRECGQEIAAEDAIKVIEIDAIPGRKAD